jgi:hypothetical protein
MGQLLAPLPQVQLSLVASQNSRHWRQ